MTSVLSVQSYSAIPFALPVLLTAAATVALGTVVLWRAKLTPESLSLVLLTGSVALWLGPAGLMMAARDPEVATTWARLGMAGVPLLGPAMFTFVGAMLTVRHLRMALIPIWAVGFLFSGMALATDLLVAGVRPNPWGFYFAAGLLGIPVVLFNVALGAASWTVLWRSHRGAAHDTERQRIRMLELTFALGAIGTIDILPMFGLPLFPFGFAGVFGSLLLLAWTIRRHRLVDLTPAFAADQVLATMADPVLFVDVSGRVRFANRAFGEVFGYGPEELDGAPVRRLVDRYGPGDDALRDLLSEVAERDREMVLYARAGDTIEVSASASQVIGDQGEPIGSVLIARDVRERKRSEALLRQREERFRSLIENISDAVVVLDAQGVITFASPAVTRITGYSVEERLGRTFFEFVHPDDLDAVRKTFSTNIQRPGYVYTGEQRLQHRDGSWRTIEVTATNLLENPAVGGIAIAYRDITDRKKAEAALRVSQEQLQQAQKLEAIGRLAGGVAHDFNNLMTVVIGQARLVLDVESTPDEMREALDEICQAGERASDLTRQLLAYSRKQVLQPSEVHVDAAVRDLERMLRRLIGEHVDLQVRLDREIGPIWADPAQFQQVVLNLVVNARDAMPEGGSMVLEVREVSLTSDSRLVSGEMVPGRYVEMSVSDSGTGIARESLSKIFEPFFTTKDRSKGTGLGLATVYGIVTQSGGTITVDSAVGAGTTFRVYFPRSDSARPAPDPLPDAPAESGRETILLVEDAEAVRALGSRILRRQGYTVLEAENGSEAVRIASDLRQSLDLVVTDVVMPVMGGRELAQRLDQVRPGTPVLFMSGYTDDEILNHGIEEGMPFLAKPFTPDQLGQKVRAVLDESLLTT